jgi:geranylgeranyl diphosphate synthase, type I
MEAKDYLKDYIKKSEPFLDSVFKAEEQKGVKISPLIEEMMQMYRQFMGGKNIRGSLVKLGYECFNGKDEKAILEASLMVEICHAFLLMHDDIMDQDDLRRGKPTIHVQYEKLHQQRCKKGDSGHYGTCMAIDLGDVGLILSSLVLANSRFSPEIKERVLRRFHQVLLETAFGQAIDVSYENLETVTEKDVMRVHHYKTANYTITGPLQYGALFAGASEDEIGKIEKYGLPLGIAFQLRDDELGLFSDEEKTGKPMGSDIRENKNTLLRIKAVELADSEDKNFLQHAYGNQNLTKAEVKKVQEITVKTGALKYSQELARKLVEEGKKNVTQITDNPEFQSTLYKAADYMIERES